LTRLAVLRLLTNRVAMNGAPVTPKQALQAWGQLRNDPRSVQVESEPAAHESRFISLVSGRESTPNLWTDAWLAALAMALDYEVTTFDRGFKSFRGLRLRLLYLTPDIS
jgi:predicted nucleic acid-binding protein